MSQLKRISIGAAAAAIVVETGAKNLVLWTLVTIGTPATTAGFVYEVVQMRQSRLQQEATDRAHVQSKRDGSSSDVADQDGRAPRTTAADTDAGPDTDLRHRLTSMLIARAHFVDIYGNNPESVTPLYRKIALDMMADDERMFAKLEAEKLKDLDGYLFDLQQDEAHLRVLHAQVTTLVQPPGTPLPATPSVRK
ncbi:hypothetical protein [Beijerinckia sp. L45]|uniref:hypothetical protein n=1 Tax=Beijerinckia sp. L45 TaxID=1641855 RepID=UPI00131AC81D|nr:hypothetical protein [Beijerinckia sp. L45]